MDDVINDILRALETCEHLDAKALDRIVRQHSKRAHDGRRLFAKKHILAYYLDAKENDPSKFALWNVDDVLDERMIATLKMKPRRTASGVATITVITKPWKCANSCIYCPNDVRMPKSYLHDEPACQRAERNFFDPYLQVVSRLHALQNMGHATDKVELIVLGGTWNDYPESYRIWFIHELFSALNDSDELCAQRASARRGFYEGFGIQCEPEILRKACCEVQKRVSRGDLDFNEAIELLYGANSAWSHVSISQKESWEELEAAHLINESSAHRVVGLVVETRPAQLDCGCLRDLRRLGCTKVQMGVQSIDERILKLNGRAGDLKSVRRAFELCRLFGFKTHAHFMTNLYGSTPESDKRDYELFISDEALKPDEAKLYPCALVDGTALVEYFRDGTWRPYSEDELVDVLVSDMLATPEYMRISRMIRDISARDIMVGNKKTNLRQIVDSNLASRASQVREIRFREIATSEIDLETLDLDDVCYQTSVSTEHFLQWITPERKIAGFLRLSLPNREAIERLGSEAPVNIGEAMIREVHVYGFAAKLSSDAVVAQHHGLGRALVERACVLAREAGYERINVISAVGTRGYYRKLGFFDNGLYQQRLL